MNTLRDLKKLVKQFSSSIMTSAKSLIISTKFCFSIENWLPIGPTEETFTEANLKKAYGSKLFSMEVTYDSRIYRWIATFPFPTKRLDNSYSHRGGCWSCGMFYHPTWNVSHGGCHLSRSFARRSPFLYPGNWFLYWSDHLWLDGFHHHYLHQGNSIIKSDTAIGITFSSFLALGVILISVAKSSTDLFHILLGISSLSKIRTCGSPLVWGHWFSWLSGFSLNNYWLHPLTSFG